MAARGSRKNVVAFHDIARRVFRDFDPEGLDRGVACIAGKRVSTARTGERVEVRLKSGREQAIATRIFANVVGNDVTDSFDVDPAIG